MARMLPAPFGLAVVLMCSSASAEIVISKKPTQNMNCNAGVCMPTAQNAVLNVGDVTSMLAQGDLTVQSGNGDGTAAAITIADGFSWTSTSRLTLSMKKSITVKAPVVVAGTGAMTLNYNQGNVGGDLLFAGKGKIDLWNLSSDLVVNQRKLTLLGTLRMLIDATSSRRGSRHGTFAMANDYDASPDGEYKGSLIRKDFFGLLEGLGHNISNLKIKNGNFLFDLYGEIRDLGLINLTVQAGGGGLVNENYGKLTNDHVSGAIGKGSYYVGLLAGRNFGTIENCSTNGTASGHDVGGLVGVQGVNGIISNSISSTQVVGSDGNTGGLVGYAYGTITMSKAMGAVEGGYSAGGLVGQNGGDIVNSSASGTVKNARDSVGGLVGVDGGEISTSHASGSVSSSSTFYVGGLVGDTNRDTIANSYSTGDVGSARGAAGGLAGITFDSSISAAYSTGFVATGNGSFAGGFIGSDYAGYDVLAADYWDLDTSGITDPSQGVGDVPNHSGVAGLSDAELKSGLPPGFDPKIWASDPNINNGYPYLLANPPR